MTNNITYKKPGPFQGPCPSDEHYANLPHPSELTYAEAKAEAESNGHHWRQVNKDIIDQLRADGVQGFQAVLDAGPLSTATAVGQRQEALSRWHEFYEGDEQHNQVFGYPEGHPKATTAR